MTEPDPDPVEPSPTTKQHLRRAWQQARAAGAKVHPDQLAQQFEQTTGALVDRAEARLHGRRGGGFTVAALHQTRLGLSWTIRSWHLVLLQVPSVLLLAAVAYSVRVRALGVKDIRDYALDRLWLLVLAVAVLTTAVLACNTVFAFALVRGRDRPIPVPAAWSETRARLGRVVLAALLVTVAMSALAWLGRKGGWLSYTASGVAMIVVLSVGLASLPFLLTELPRHREPLRDRAQRRQRAERRALRTSSSALITIPTVLVIELGRLLTRLPGVRWTGVLLVAAGGLLHTAAQSSARAIKLTATMAASDDPTREMAEAEADGDLEVGPPPEVSPPAERGAG